MQRDRWRFSVRRLMLIVAVAAVLLAIGVEQGARLDDGARTQCMNNLKQIGLGILSYSTAKGTYPSGTIANASLPPQKRLSWYLAITPYLDYGPIYPDIVKSDPWDSPTNAPFACTDFPVQRCPADRTPQTSGRAVPTPYVGIAGLGIDAPTLPKSDRRAGVFGYDRATTRADIKDGLATTMMVAETWDARGSWLAGGPATVRGLDPSRQPYIGPGRPFGGLHRRGAAILMADGSVRFISPSVDPRVFEALSTIAGGETIPTDFDP